MKMRLFITILLLFITSLAFSQADTITTAQAKDFIGKEVILTGKVVATRVINDRNGKQIMFINLDAKHPENLVDVVIFNDVFEKMKLVEGEILNKTIKIKGKLSTYKEKPQMIIQSEESLSY